MIIMQFTNIRHTKCTVVYIKNTNVHKNDNNMQCGERQISKDKN